MITNQEALFDSENTHTISNRGLAELVGVTEGAIRKAIRLGVITAVIDLPSGKRVLERDRAVAEWHAAHVQPAAAPVEPGNAFTLTDHRIRFEQARADITEMDRDERRGHLFHAEDVFAHGEAVIMAAKAKLLTLKSKLIAVLPGDPAVNGRLVDGVLREALQELAEYDYHAITKYARRRRRKITAPEAE